MIKVGLAKIVLASVSIPTLLALAIAFPTVASLAMPASEMPTTDGALDPTFGIGGNVSTSFPIPIQSRAHASAIQTDGKIVIAGDAGDFDNSNYNDFSLTRYNTDGTLDNTFNGNGRVQTDFTANEDHANGLAI